MATQQKSMPVIVLLDNQVSGERKEIREWFAHSRFATCEAMNIFEALEQLSDFTIETRPDVVLLNVDCSNEEISMVENVSEVPVVAFGTGRYFNANMGKMVTRLNELIPLH
jgi:hypothetical protein